MYYTTNLYSPENVLATTRFLRMFVVTVLRNYMRNVENHYFGYNITFTAARNTIGWLQMENNKR